MKNLNELVAEKKEMVTKGQILEAIEKFFAAEAKTVDFTGRKAYSKQEAIDG
jgi:ribosomal protein L23